MSVTYLLSVTCSSSLLKPHHYSLVCLTFGFSLTNTEKLKKTSRVKWTETVFLSLLLRSIHKAKQFLHRSAVTDDEQQCLDFCPTSLPRESAKFWSMLELKIPFSPQSLFLSHILLLFIHLHPLEQLPRDPRSRKVPWTETHLLFFLDWLQNSLKLPELPLLWKPLEAAHIHMHTLISLAHWATKALAASTPGLAQFILMSGSFEPPYAAGQERWRGRAKRERNLTEWGIAGLAYAVCFCYALASRLATEYSEPPWGHAEHRQKEKLYKKTQNRATVGVLIPGSYGQLIKIH